MAGNFLTEQSLEVGVAFFSQELRSRDIEHFIFFGTLLGFTRDGQPVKGDDDVDFYVCDDCYQAVHDMLSSLGIVINYQQFPNNTRHFIQVHGAIDSIELRVDFYFYNKSLDEDFILERWNFMANPEDDTNLLKLAKPLVYPIESTTYKGYEINVPRFPRIICEYLYGVNWRVPKSKGVDYQIIMRGGRPIMLTNQDGRLSFDN